MRSSVFLPRRHVGACSPSTHLIASTTLDLPHPLGPTTAVTPGAKLMLVCSQKDLKPTSSRLLRRIYHRLRHTTIQPARSYLLKGASVKSSPQGKASKSVHRR